MPPLRRISSSFGGQRHGLVRRALRLVREAAGHGIEAELVAVARIGDRLGALHDVQPEVEAVAAEDVPHVVAADDDHLEAGLLGDALEAGRAHLARRSDREPVAGDDEGLPAVHARAEVGHQVAERAGFPLLVERLEALGHAVGGRRDLIRVDRVAFLGELRPWKAHRIPEDERPSTDEVVGLPRALGGSVRQRLDGHAGLATGGLDPVHATLNASIAALTALRDRLIAGAPQHRDRRVARKARIGERQAAQIEPRAAGARHDLHVRARLAQSRAAPIRLPRPARIVHHAPYVHLGSGHSRRPRLVQSEYAPEQSQPAKNQWFFLYTVTITNEGEETVQLLTRHWIITDGTGHVEEVRGPGVVGKQPTLKPGESFEYTSGCPLSTPFGVMEGTYQMVTQSGERFDAKVAPFTLGGAVHRSLTVSGLWSLVSRVTRRPKTPKTRDQGPSRTPRPPSTHPPASSDTSGAGSRSLRTVPGAA